jgi:hypothetical protein
LADHRAPAAGNIRQGGYDRAGAGGRRNHSPLGGAIIPYVVDPKDLAAASRVQVLNTKAIGIRFAEMCVTFGMTQSKLSYRARSSVTTISARRGGFQTRP